MVRYSDDLFGVSAQLSWKNEIDFSYSGSVSFMSFFRVSYFAGQS